MQLLCLQNLQDRTKELAWPGEERLKILMSLQECSVEIHEFKMKQHGRVPEVVVADVE